MTLPSTQPARPRSIRRARRHPRSTRLHQLCAERLELRTVLAAFLSGEWGWVGTFSALASDTATDANGNVYVTGGFSGTNYNAPLDFDTGPLDYSIRAKNGTDPAFGDGFLAKYSAQGTFLWIRALTVQWGKANPSNIEVATDGSVRVVGTAFNQHAWATSSLSIYDPAESAQSLTSVGPGQTETFVCSFAGNGTFEWLTLVPRLTTTLTSPAFDSTTNSLLVGYGSDELYYVTATGTLQTSPLPYRRLSDLGGTTGRVGLDSAAFDIHGNLYLAGQLRGGADFDPSDVSTDTYSTFVWDWDTYHLYKIRHWSNDVFVAKYSTTGVFEWVTVQGTATTIDTLESLAVSPSGSVSVALANSLYSTDRLVTSYAANGQTILSTWVSFDTSMQRFVSCVYDSTETLVLLTRNGFVDLSTTPEPALTWRHRIYDGNISGGHYDALGRAVAWSVGPLGYSNPWPNTRMDASGSFPLVTGTANNGAASTFPGTYFAVIGTTNAAPTAVSLTTSMTSIAENTVLETPLKVADISVVDDSQGTNTLWLSGPDTDSFAIIDQSLYLKAGTTLNYEMKSTYSVDVTVADSSIVGSQPQATGFTLHITNINEVPADLSLSSVTVTENSAIGTTVGTLSTTDVDASDTFSYSLISGTGSTDNAAFTIVGGQLTTAASFNYETKNSYSIRIRSTDAGGLYIEKAFTVTVTNSNEAPTDFSLSASVIAENAAIGTVVGSLSTTDVDAGDTFTYSLASGTGSTDNAAFTIAGSQLTTAALLNYETKNSYSIRIRSTDAGGLYTEKAFTISVTNVNEAPTALALTGITASFPENADTSIRIKVADILVTDDALGVNTLTLSGTDAASFEIDRTTLFLKAATRLNYEAKASYDVTVNARDSAVTGSATLSVNYTLTITNANEAPTDLSLSASVVAENSAIGTVVGFLSTTDFDAGDTFTYSLVSGTGSSDNAVFIIVGGQLSTAASFNYEAKNSYSIRIRSTDAGGLYTEKAFTVSVTDVNEALRIEQLIHATPGAYKAGQQLTWQIVCSQNVIVVGRPTIPLRIGSKQVFAVYAGGSGTNRLAFAYRVANRDNGATVTVGNAIALSSASRIFAGTTRLPPTLPGGTAVAPGVGIDTTAPKPVGRLAVPAARIYSRGQMLEFRVRFTEPVYVAGVPQISLRIGATAKTADYVTGSGTAELVFRYVVTAGDATPIGKGILLGRAVVGGMITDAAANLASRTLSVPSTTAIRVDGGPLNVLSLRPVRASPILLSHK